MFKRFFAVASGFGASAFLAFPSLALAQLARPVIDPAAWGLTEQARTSPTPSDVSPDRYLQADALRKQGKNKDAFDLLKKAIWFDGDCGKCFGLLSGIESNLEMYTQGVGDGDIGVKRSTTPRHKAMGAYNKGLNLGHLNRKSEALEAYNLSTECDPTYAMAYFGKGKTFYELSYFEKADDEIMKALDLDSEYGPSWAYRSLLATESGNGPLALAYGSIAVNLAPKDPRSYRARAFGWMLNGVYDDMLADAT